MISFIIYDSLEVCGGVLTCRDSAFRLYCLPLVSECVPPVTACNHCISVSPLLCSSLYVIDV